MWFGAQTQNTKKAQMKQQALTGNTVSKAVSTEKHEDGTMRKATNLACYHEEMITKPQKKSLSIY